MATDDEVVIDEETGWPIPPEVLAAIESLGPILELVQQRPAGGSIDDDFAAAVDEMRAAVESGDRSPEFLAAAHHARELGEMRRRLTVPDDVPGPPDTQLDIEEIERLCALYFEGYRRTVEHDDGPDLLDEVDQTSMWFQMWSIGDPERLWPIVTALIDRAPDEGTLFYVAAGPLEDLVRNHGARLVDRLADRAEANPRFRMALKGVWGWDLMPAVMRDRLYPILNAEDDTTDLPQRP